MPVAVVGDYLPPASYVLWGVANKRALYSATALDFKAKIYTAFSTSKFKAVAEYTAKDVAAVAVLAYKIRWGHVPSVSVWRSAGL